MEVTKLNGKQIKEGTIDLYALYSMLGLGAGDTGKAFIYTHTPVPDLSFKKVKFLDIDGVPGGLTVGQALILNGTGDGVASSPYVRTFNGVPGDIIFNNSDQLAEGSTNLFWTNARFDTRFDTRLGTKSTSDLAEGTNLYWTNARFDTRFATSFAAKKLQDISNVDITGISQGDLLQYDLANDKYIYFTPQASNIVLNPIINDGNGNYSNAQTFLESLNTKNQLFSHTLLTLTLTTYTSDGTYIVNDDDVNADVLIISFDKTSGTFFITSPIAGTIFNSTNTPSNGFVNIYVTGSPGSYQLKIDNQTAITKKIKVRKVM